MNRFIEGGRLTDRHKNTKIDTSKYIQALNEAYKEGMPHSKIKLSTPYGEHIESKDNAKCMYDEYEKALGFKRPTMVYPLNRPPYYDRMADINEKHGLKGLEKWINFHE